MMGLEGIAGGGLKFLSNEMKKKDQEEENRKQAILGLHQKFQNKLGTNFTAVAPPPKSNIGADLLGAVGDMAGGGDIGNMVSGLAGSKGQEFTPGQGWADKAPESSVSAATNPAPQPQAPEKISTDTGLDDWISDKAEQGRKDIYGNMARSYLG